MTDKQLFLTFLLNTIFCIGISGGLHFVDFPPLDLHTCLLLAMFGPLMAFVLCVCAAECSS